jgi:hypothetical protein
MLEHCLTARMGACQPMQATAPALPVSSMTAASISTVPAVVGTEPSPALNRP